MITITSQSMESHIPDRRIKTLIKVLHDHIDLSKIALEKVHQLLQENPNISLEEIQSHIDFAQIGIQN